LSNQDKLILYINKYKNTNVEIEKKKHLDFVLYNLYSYISCLQTAEMTRHSRSYVTGPRTRAPNAPEI